MASKKVLLQVQVVAAAGMGSVATVTAALGLQGQNLISPASFLAMLLVCTSIGGVSLPFGSCTRSRHDVKASKSFTCTCTRLDPKASGIPYILFRPCWLAQRDPMHGIIPLAILTGKINTYKASQRCCCSRLCKGNAVFDRLTMQGWLPGCLPCY